MGECHLFNPSMHIYGAPKLCAKRQQVLPWAVDSGLQAAGRWTRQCTEDSGVLEGSLGGTLCSLPHPSCHHSGVVCGTELPVSPSPRSDSDSISSHLGRQDPGAMFRLAALSFLGRSAAHNSVRDGHCSGSCVIVGEIEDSREATSAFPKANRPASQTTVRPVVVPIVGPVPA